MPVQQRADLVGLKCNMLTVVSFSHVDKHAYWNCKCDCGNEVVLPTNRLQGKRAAKSCGCLQRSNLTGQRFNRLLVIEPTGKKINGNYTWLCKCDCGETIEVAGSSLTTGATQSCGCLNWDNRNKHGMTNTSLYMVWDAFKRRCRDPNHAAYKNYGGRGIYVCDEWKEDFLVFYEWARANGYKEGLSIDRIDNNGPYSPENCRWATDKEQNRNSRNIKLYTYKGEDKCIAEWAEEYNMRPDTLHHRLQKMSIEEALTKVLYKRKSFKRNKKEVTES
jgi:hypothetical protein